MTSRIRWCAVVLLAGLLPLAAPSVSAQQIQLGASAAMTATSFARQPGRRLTVVCAAVVAPRSVWGSDNYSTDSSICTAAVHAGVLAPGRAGAVTLVIGAGADSLPGSVRNGITSKPAGRVAGTYRFDASGEPGQLDWITTAGAVPAGFGDALVVRCPAGGRAAVPVWGTGRYTGDSGICVAAVHAGVITLEAGGPVQLRRAAHPGPFEGSLRHGITSRHITTSPASFTVAAPAATSVAVPSNPATEASSVTTATSPAAPPGDSTASSSATLPPRSITLPGWTAAGAYATLAPRSVTLPGWTAAGAYTTLAPRSITLPGWTAAGIVVTAPSRTIREIPSGAQ